MSAINSLIPRLVILSLDLPLVAGGGEFLAD